MIDAGALLFPQPFIAASQFAAKNVQAEGIMKAMSQMGYDAFGLAPQDLAAGTVFLKHQPKDIQLPWLSSNIVSKDTRQLLFKPYILKPFEQITVAVIGLTGPFKTAANQSFQSNYQVLGWEKALKTVMGEIKNQADMIILLSSMAEQTNRLIAKQFSDINLIIQSGHATGGKRPQLFGNTLITQISSRGKHVGRLDINWESSRRWEQSASAQTKSVKDRLDRTNWQIGRLKKKYPPETVEQNAQYKRLLLEKDKLSSELQKLEAQQKENQEKFSTYKSTFISLPISLQQNTEIRKIVLETKNAVNDTNRQMMLMTQNSSLEKTHEAFSNLAGWTVCQACHEQQTEFWKETAHASAWQTLKKVKQQFNPECLICHVTLPTYDQETVTTQNLLAGMKEEYKTIGCETCHGGGKNHVQQPDKYIPAKPDEKICLTCHTPERDDDFIYSKKLKKIRCPSSGH